MLQPGAAAASRIILDGDPHPDSETECGQRLLTAMAAVTWWGDNLTPAEQLSALREQGEEELRAENRRADEVLQVVGMVAGYDREYWAQARKWVLAHPFKVPDE